MKREKRFEVEVSDTCLGVEVDNGTHLGPRGWPLGTKHSGLFGFDGRHVR